MTLFDTRGNQLGSSTVRSNGVWTLKSSYINDGKHDVYVILSPLIHPSSNSSPNMRPFNQNELDERYPGIKKIENMESYSSHLAPKISKDELKQKILDLGLIN